MNKNIIGATALILVITFIAFGFKKCVSWSHDYEQEQFDELISPIVIIEKNSYSYIDKYVTVKDSTGKEITLHGKLSFKLHTQHNIGDTIK